MTYLSYIFTCFFALLCSVTMLASAHAKEILYNCPDLHDTSKRSIEPLTQGYDGWFFRQNDMKTDFSMSPQSLAYFKRLNDTLKAKDITLVIMPLLSRAMLAQDMVKAYQKMYHHFKLLC